MKTIEEKAKEYIDNLIDSLSLDVNHEESNYDAGQVHALSDYGKEIYKVGFLEGQSNPKIKQLEWCEEQCSNEDIPYNHVKANSPLGTYTIQWKGWKDYDDKTIFLDGVFVSMGGFVLDDAKILAQNLFEKRVKECLI